MIPYIIGKLAPNSSLSPKGGSNMSPDRAIYVAFPPKTGKMLHPRPPPSIVERVSSQLRIGVFKLMSEVCNGSKKGINIYIPKYFMGVRTA